MARIRQVKPSYFTDEELNDISLEAHFLFGGLWCQADREGRIEDRPRYLKIQIFPFRDVDIEAALTLLSTTKNREGKPFIKRYEANGIKVIQITNFLRHQIPGRDEPQSELPSETGLIQEYIKPPNDTVRARIYQRDGFLCAYCGLDMKDKARARCLDHIEPYSRGGSNDETNLVTCCKRCNAIKSDRTPEEVGFDRPIINGVSASTNHPLTGSDDKGLGLGEGIGEREWSKPTDKTHALSKNFKTPTPQEVDIYAQEIGYTRPGLGAAFCDFYGAKGWVVGKSPMRDWRAAVRTWKQRDAQGGANGTGQKRGAVPVPGKYSHLG